MKRKRRPTAASQIEVMQQLRDGLVKAGAEQAEVDRANLEAQVMKLTGGMGFKAHQEFEKAREGQLNAELEGECPVCFLEGGQHEDECPNRA